MSDLHAATICSITSYYLASEAHTKLSYAVQVLEHAETVKKLSEQDIQLQQLQRDQASHMASKEEAYRSKVCLLLNTRASTQSNVLRFIVVLWYRAMLTSTLCWNKFLCHMYSTKCFLSLIRGVNKTVSEYCLLHTGSC